MYKIDYVDGVKLVYCKNVGLTSLFGIMTLNGSFYENRKNQGISHFCEHMFYKGTNSRNYEELAQDIESIGADQNAYTDNSEVFYYISAYRDYYSQSIYNLMDMFFNSSYPEEEIEKEKLVVLEEMKRYREEHISRIYNDMGKKFFYFEYGHSTLGEEDTVSSFTRRDVVDYLNETINKSTICFVYSGEIDIEIIKDEIRKNMPNGHSFLKDGEMREVLIPSLIRADVSDKLLEIESKEITQNYVFDLCSGYDIDDSSTYALEVFSSAFGGSGFFNKMFMEIREKNGMAYACGCWPTFEHVKNIGSFMRYAMISDDMIDQYSECLDNLCKDVIKNGIPKKMIDCAIAKELFSIAKMSTCNYSLSKKAVMSFYGEIIDPLEKSNFIKNVSYKRVNEVAEDILSRDITRIIMKPN